MSVESSSSRCGRPPVTGFVRFISPGRKGCGAKFRAAAQPHLFHGTTTPTPPGSLHVLLPSVMVWLDGKPTLAKILAWPADDPDLKREGRIRQGWSVLDDQILFWRAFSSEENLRTVIYMANTTYARDMQSEAVSLERVAELDYAAHRLAIVTDVGFVTAEWRSVYILHRNMSC